MQEIVRSLSKWQYVDMYRISRKKRLRFWGFAYSDIRKLSFGVSFQLWFFMAYNIVPITIKNLLPDHPSLPNQMLQK